MKNKFLFHIIIVSLVFFFVIFYKGIDYSNTYIPQKYVEKKIPFFIAKDLYSQIEISSEKIFEEDKFYILNIWASWCVPCRDEHPLLVNLSKNDKLEIIGLNYKDNLKNAEKFLNELGNPYKKILIDRDGTKAIEWGAFGVPETFLVFENKIVKKFIGPLNFKSIEEIEEIIK